MKSNYTSFMQSKFFSPGFNSAIFDGPLRIYFSQFHESLALKIYFMIQQKLKAELATAKELTKESKQNLLIMIYPTEESIAMSFDVAGSQQKIFSEDWDDDQVLGLRAPFEDSDLPSILEQVAASLNDWPEVCEPGLEESPQYR